MVPIQRKAKGFLVNMITKHGRYIWMCHERLQSYSIMNEIKEQMIIILKRYAKSAHSMLDHVIQNSISDWFDRIGMVTYVKTTYKQNQ